MHILFFLTIYIHHTQCFVSYLLSRTLIYILTYHQSALVYPSLSLLPFTATRSLTMPVTRGSQPSVFCCVLFYYQTSIFRMEFLSSFIVYRLLSYQSYFSFGLYWGFKYVHRILFIQPIGRIQTSQQISQSSKWDIRLEPSYFNLLLANRCC